MDKMFYKKIGDIIKEKRKERKLTQVQLAKLLDMPASTLACYEAGLRGMELDTFFMICRFLDIDPNDVQKRVRR